MEGSDSEQEPVVSSLSSKTALEFCSFLSFFECYAIPKNLFVRGCKSRNEWTYSGQVRKRPPTEANIPSWLLQLFEGNEEAEDSYFNRYITPELGCGVINTEGEGVSECFTINEAWRQHRRIQTQPQDILDTLFGILALVSQAFPEPYAELLWEEMELEQWGIIESTCLPFLAVLNAGDALEYIYHAVPNTAFKTYLASLLKILLRFCMLCGEGRAPNILPLASGLIQEMVKSHKIPAEELEYFQLLVEIVKETRRSKSDGLSLADRFRNLDHNGSQRSNASLGFALVSIYKNADGVRPWQEPEFWWNPLCESSPSTMEMLALANLSGNSDSVLHLGDSWKELALEAKIIIGFNAAQNGAYEIAREILEQSAMAIATSYGGCSREFLVTVVELVNCCNVLSDEEKGEAWARLARAYASSMNRGSKSVYETYLTIATADSLIGQVKYTEAKDLLLEVLKDKSTSGDTVALTSLRLSKICRRQRIEGSSEICDNLSNLTSNIDNISQELQYECLEESLCLLSMLDLENDAQAPRVRELVRILLKYSKGASNKYLPSRPYFTRYIQDLQSYREKLSIFTVSGPELFFCQKIRDKFPIASVDLIELLGTTCWQRKNRVETMKMHADEHTDSPSPELDTDPTPMTHDSVLDSGFHDSGLGTSLPTVPSSKTEAYKSLMSSIGAGISKLPAMPKEARSGKPFSCDVCGELVKDIRSESQWKHHIHSDLQSYVCIVKDCPAGFMSSRHEFATHLGQHNFKMVWVCNDCGCRIDDHDGTPALSDHMKDVHLRPMKSNDPSKEFSLERIPLDLDKQLCPLCHNVPGAAQFVGHICHHLEDLALSLSAIPPSDDPDSDRDDPKPLDPRKSDIELAGPNNLSPEQTAQTTKNHEASLSNQFYSDREPRYQDPAASILQPENNPAAQGFPKNREPWGFRKDMDSLNNLGPPTDHHPIGYEFHFSQSQQGNEFSHVTHRAFVHKEPLSRRTPRYPVTAAYPLYEDQFQAPVGYGGHNRLTEPQSYEGPYTTRHFTPGPPGPLGEAFQVQNAQFFEFGTVFQTPWSEPAASSTQSSKFNTAWADEYVCSQIRRMVVVKNAQRHSLCVPISTYGRRGTLKPGVNTDDHAIIHMVGQEPKLLDGESPLVKRPIAVVGQSRERLNQASRINFGKIYTVEHNTKVQLIGKVSEKSLTYLEAYWRQ